MIVEWEGLVGMVWEGLLGMVWEGLVVGSNHLVLFYLYTWICHTHTHSTTQYILILTPSDYTIHY